MRCSVASFFFLLSHALQQGEVVLAATDRFAALWACERPVAFLHGVLVLPQARLAIRVPAVEDLGLLAVRVVGVQA